MEREWNALGRVSTSMTASGTFIGGSFFSNTAVTVARLKEYGVVRVPWGGRSPRELTRTHSLFIFKTQGGKSLSGDDCGDQLELWPITKKGRPRYSGAAPLLPLPKGVDDGF